MHSTKCVWLSIDWIYARGQMNVVTKYIRITPCKQSRVPLGLEVHVWGLANSLGSNIFLWNCLADTTSIQVAHNLLTPSNHVYGYAKPAFHLG